MNYLRATKSLWVERLIIVALSTSYLVAFNRTVPHGDALRVVRQIQARDLIWNPNHLTFDPFGYGWFVLSQYVGINMSVLDSFELISGIATISSLLLFHALLLQIGVSGLGARALAVAGLFASQGFLSMAISQYYFMMQMPFLLGVLILAVRFASKEETGYLCTGCLCGMGLLSAIAGTIMFNNVLLVAALGLAAGFTRCGRPVWNFRNAARLWGPAAALGLPVFMFGYVASGNTNGFFSWLFSYQGDSGTKLNDLYGIDWTLAGVAESLGRATFNLLSASVIETAGMGTAVKVLVFREPVEFIPETGKLLLALSLTPLIAGTLVVLLLWAARRLRQDRFAQFAFAWIGAYFVFNALWNSTGDLFWFQLLPVMWLLLMAYLDFGRGMRSGETNENMGQKRWQRLVLALTVPALLTVNTLQTVNPVSLVDLEARGAEHMALLRDGDLEVVPGWDGLGWMELDPAGPRVERITLMEMALQAEGGPRHIEQLPLIVANHLAGGGRVVAARLYDKDHGINPWYGLARLGWPRAKIHALLSGFCHRDIGRVGDVVFRELLVCR